MEPGGDSIQIRYGIRHVISNLQRLDDKSVMERRKCVSWLWFLDWAEKNSDRFSRANIVRVVTKGLKGYGAVEAQRHGGSQQVDEEETPSKIRGHAERKDTTLWLPGARRMKIRR